MKWVYTIQRQKTEREVKQMKQTLLFKKSLLDKDCIEVPCKKWYTTKNGTYIVTFENETVFYSSNDYYFWGIK